MQQEKRLTRLQTQTVSESVIKRHIMQYLRLKGIFAWVNVSGGIYDPARKIFRKLNGFGMMRGTSDILGVYNGKMLAIEVKNVRGVVSEEQQYFIEQVTRHGGIAFVARSIEDVDRELSNGKTTI